MSAAAIHRSIDIELIDAPTDPHRLSMDPDALVELAQDIEKNGLINPLCVRPTAGGRFEVVAGHRRLEALRMLGASEALCSVPEMSAEQYEEIKFAENLQRTDLTPMEESLAVTKLRNTTGATMVEISRKLNRSLNWVQRRMDLNNIPDDLKAVVHTGELGAGAALELAKVKDVAHRNYLTTYALKSGASAGILKEWVRQWEVQAASGDSSGAPLPEIHQIGGAVTVQMPCFICGSVHDHTKLAIVRACKNCVNEIAAAARALPHP